MATRDYLVLYLNGQRREVRGGDCFLSLSDYLRDRCRFGGHQDRLFRRGLRFLHRAGRATKAGDRFDYLPIDSCIRFMFQLDGTHRR